MKQPREYRFFPLPIVFLGVVVWTTLTFFACRSALAANHYELSVIVFGVALTSMSMACVAGWTALLLALLTNWSVSTRRMLFRKPLIGWSTFFGFVTVLGIWSVFFLDS